MESEPTLPSLEFSVPEAGPDAHDAAAATKRVVLSLRVVGAPFALPELNSSLLKGVRFFFTRRNEPGAHGCWLQLGYFSSLREAGECLERLRPLYPDAFATAVSSGARSASE